MTWELVGRADELALGAEALDEAALVALTGPPGVGKSRLLAEFVARADAVGRPTYQALSTEATRTVPLSPFVALLPSAPPPDPSLLLAAVVDAVEAAGHDAGLLVAVDDAHHLDDGSLALLAVLMASSSAQVMLTTSDDHARPPGLTALLRDDRATALEVPPLPRTAVDLLVEQALGPTTDVLRRELWDLCRGNPLMLREVLADIEPTLARRADGVRRSSGSPVGRRVRDLARERTERLPDDVTDGLLLVAVGAPVPVEVLAAAMDPDSFDRLLASSVVETSGVGRGARRVARPAHPLYGEVLLTTLGERERRAAFDRLLDAAVKATAPVDPVRLAIWQRGSSRVAEPSVALEGARSALARQDPALALSLLDSVADTVDPATDALLRGSILVQQGRHEDAEAVFASADPTDRAPGAAASGPHTVDVAAVRAFNLGFGLRRPRDAVAVLTAAAEATHDPVARGRLDAERGVIAGIGGDFSLALSAAREAIGNPASDEPALLSAYVSLTLAQTMLGDLFDMERHARAGEALALRGSATLPLAGDQILVMEATAAMLRGDVEHAATIVREARSSDRRLTSGLWSATEAMVASYAGRLGQAVAASDTAMSTPDTSELFGLGGLAVGTRSIADGQRGRVGPEGELAELRATHPEPRNAVWIDRGRAWALAAAGEHQRALALAVDAGHHAIDHQHLSWGVLALHDGVRFARPGGDRGLADVLAAAVARTSGAGLLDSMARHAQALADGSSKGLSAVATEFAAAGAPLLAADAAAHAAESAAEEGDLVASARAGALAVAWQSSCPEAITPALSRRPGSGLSPRVVEIALDAAKGATSPEIAERRFLSVRTVDNHLRTAYRALGVSGRADLGTVLAPLV